MRAEEAEVMGFKEMMQRAIWGALEMKMEMTTTDRLFLLGAVILAVAAIILLIRWVD